MEFAWGIIVTVALFLVGAAMALVGMTPAHFRAARLCFLGAAILLGGMCLVWQVLTPTPLLLRLCVGGLIGGLIGMGLPEGFRWVAHREGVTASAVNTPASLSEYSNAQIKDSALALARRMRQLQQEQNRKQSQLLLNFQSQWANAPKKKKELEEWSRQRQLEMNKRMSEISSETDTRFGPLRAEARTILFHLTNRVPNPQPLPSELVNFALAGSLAGPNPINAVADYIEQLAQLVPVIR